VAGDQLADVSSDSGEILCESDHVSDGFPPGRVGPTRKALDERAATMCPLKQWAVARGCDNGPPTVPVERRQQIEQAMLRASKVTVLVEHEKIHFEYRAAIPSAQK
jgi:hypothetical protein